LPTRVTWVNSKGKRWLYPQMMETPNKQCFICQKSVVHLTLNPELFNYGSFVKTILQKNLGFKQPDITIEFDGGSNLLESMTEGDDEEEKKEKAELLDKPLDDPRIKIFDRCSCSIDDFSQDVQVNLVVHYLTLDEEQHPLGFELTNNWNLSKFKVAAAQSGGGDGSTENTEKGRTNGSNGSVRGRKRKMDEMKTEEEDGKAMEEPPTKKAKIVEQ